jgi:hypothetical protein
MINLANVGEEKRISFKVSHLQVNYLVTVTLPSFDVRKATLSGDWGMNLSIQLQPQNPVRISYKNINNEETKAYPIDSSTLQFEAPMLKRTRAEFPLTLKITDHNMGVFYTFWFNSELEVKKVTSEIIHTVEVGEILHA